MEKTIEEAKKSDVVILCVGEDTYTETMGNISNLALENLQFELGRNLASINIPLVLVYLGGRPRVMTELVENAQAVLLGFLPGTRGSEAIADILFGEYNPSACLPITYPMNTNGYTTYDHSSIEVSLGNLYECLYPFGHGMSYSKFTYSRLLLSSQEFVTEMAIQVDVLNEGPFDGKHVIMLFLNDEYGSVPRPMKQLKKFKKIDLKVKEKTTVSFNIDLYDLSFIGLDLKRIVEPGSFNVYLGDLSAKFILKSIPADIKF